MARKQEIPAQLQMNDDVQSSCGSVMAMLDLDACLLDGGRFPGRFARTENCTVFVLPPLGKKDSRTRQHFCSVDVRYTRDRNIL